MPRKRDLPGVRRLQLIMLGSGLIASLGCVVVVEGLVDAVHHRSGGVVGVVVGALLLGAGAVAAIASMRRAGAVADAAWRALHERGADDGLPMGAFWQEPQIGLEASDALLMVGALCGAIGVGFLAVGVLEPDVGWQAIVLFSSPFLASALLFLRLGTGVVYWLTPEGVRRRSRTVPSVRWTDVERVVPRFRGAWADQGRLADAVELQVRIPEEPQPWWWYPRDFSISLRFVEIGGDDLLRLIRDQVGSTSGDR